VQFSDTIHTLWLRPRIFTNFLNLYFLAYFCWFCMVIRFFILATTANDLAGFLS